MSIIAPVNCLVVVVGFDSPLFGVMESTEELVVIVSVHGGTLDVPVQVYFTSDSLGATGKISLSIFCL